MGEPSEVVIPLFGILDITGEVITMWLLIAVLVLLSIYLGKHLQERPGKFQNVIETGIEYLDNSFSANLGKKRARKYFCFLGSLFIFIIFANYIIIFKRIIIIMFALGASEFILRNFPKAFQTIFGAFNAFVIII